MMASHCFPNPVSFSEILCDKILSGFEREVKAGRMPFISDAADSYLGRNCDGHGLTLYFDGEGIYTIEVRPYKKR